ncbi:hypothetical protein CHGG_01952 [Chaetomium globosum CBS 148.51]|uniref:GPI transamidase component GAB1 n=1 Tax=Chaetomium globosum (strain ATCC 6205 / CBS 148.51 / DSM 1962 / NBRC 6347 / NRRL 1970) TaxID=306901 RepID=Q2HCV2_CHAGB|nr:uncharacterized protein CHGG_01952 [Chaetomium globosum CBS 148.51]EAQ93717.1 hypothetical protein CHGG_01952 [Chaetomium globosum CBS 148.51]
MDGAKVTPGRTADSGEAGSSALFTSPRREKRWSGFVIAALYAPLPEPLYVAYSNPARLSFLFSPFTVATCLGRSTSVFTTCAILHAVAKAVSGAPFGAMVAISFASYLSLYPLLLLPPLVLLCYDRQRSERSAKSAVKFAAISVSTVAGVLAALFQMSYLITGSWEFMPSTYGVQLTLSDLTPNVGLWWYFFIEMFDSFRSFFLAVFWLHLSSYVGGLTVRIRRQPLVALTLILGIFAIFKPYPSISDAALFQAMVPLYRHVVPLMRYTFVSTAVIMYATCLGPAFYYLWIYAGSGNANFFYAITLVWNLGQSLLVCDLLFAVLRDEWEVERPEMMGKEIRQI